MSVVAVIFDFDDTLLPDSTSALLEEHGIDSKDFWTVRTRELVENGYDPPLAYLNLLLKEVGDDKPLGPLTNAELRQFGARLDETWFSGLPEILDDLRELANQHRDVSIEFYIISGGLQAVMEGSRHVSRHFSGVYGCQLGEDPGTGAISDIRRCVTFTEKTRFLFEINKGIRPEDAATQPHLVNQAVPEANRPVPFRNMIYVGDGLTDIPCFSLVEKGEGHAIGVFHPGRESAKQAFQQLVAPRRVRGLYRPEYGPDDELGAILRLAVTNTCANIEIRATRAV